MIEGRRWPARSIHAITTKRSNDRSCSRTRTANPPGRSEPSATSRDRPRGAGSGGYVWLSDDQRLHFTRGCRSPKEFTEQGLVLSGTVPHAVVNPCQMMLAMQLLDQDPLLGRQVRILLTHECDTFLG